MDPTKTHSKFWRPNILLIIDNPATGLIGFCNMLKRGGVLMLGMALPGTLDVFAEFVKPLRLAWVAFIRNYHVKAFPHLSVAPNYRQAVESLILGAGLGGLSCNTICLPLPELSSIDADLGSASGPKADIPSYLHSLMRFLIEEPSSSSDQYLCDAHYNNLPVQSASEYCGILTDGLRLEMNLIVAANFNTGSHMLHKKSFLGPEKDRAFIGLASTKPFTDVWIVGNIASSEDPGSVDVLWGQNLIPRHAKKLVVTSTEGSCVDDEASADGLEGIVALLLQLGLIADRCRLNPETGVKGMKKSKHKLRIFYVPATPHGRIESAEQSHAYFTSVAELCRRARIEVDDENIHVIMLQDVMHAVPAYRDMCPEDVPIPLNAVRPDALAKIINELVRPTVSDTCQVVMSLRAPPNQAAEAEARQYLWDLHTLTDALPPTILVCNGEDLPFISTCI